MDVKIGGSLVGGCRVGERRGTLGFDNNKADYFNEQLPKVTTPQPEAGLG